MLDLRNTRYIIEALIQIGHKSLIFLSLYRVGLLLSWKYTAYNCIRLNFDSFSHRSHDTDLTSSHVRWSYPRFGIVPVLTWRITRSCFPVYASSTRPRGFYETCSEAAGWSETHWDCTLCSRWWNPLWCSQWNLSNTSDTSCSDPIVCFPPQTNGRLSRRQRDRSSDILFISVSENIMKVWHRFYNDALFIPLFWFLSAWTPQTESEVMKL